MHFFNDRLAFTHFYLPDISTYLASLRHDGMDLPSDGELRIGTNVIVRVSQDHSEGNSPRPYVQWNDRRLEEEETKWIREWTGLPGIRPVATAYGLA